MGQYHKPRSPPSVEASPVIPEVEKQPYGPSGWPPPQNWPAFQSPGPMCGTRSQFGGEPMERPSSRSVQADLLPCGPATAGRSHRPTPPGIARGHVPPAVCHEPASAAATPCRGNSSARCSGGEAEHRPGWPSLPRTTRLAAPHVAPCSRRACAAPRKAARPRSRQRQMPTKIRAAGVLPTGYQSVVVCGPLRVIDPQGAGRPIKPLSTTARYAQKGGVPSRCAE